MFRDMKLKCDYMYFQKHAVIHIRFNGLTSSAISCTNLLNHSSITSRWVTILTCVGEIGMQNISSFS